MKTLYLECSMGASGDMLMGALLELHPDPESFLSRFGKLGIPGVEVSAEPSVRCGIRGTHIRITVDGTDEAELSHGEEQRGLHHGHEHGCAFGENHDSSGGHHHAHEEREAFQNRHGHHHTGLCDVVRVLGGLEIPDEVRSDALAVYGLLAEAESYAHGRPVEEIHFHEVGTMDAVADIVGVCWLMHELAPQFVAASPVSVGSGTVRCAHGVLPVPAPATLELLKGIPMRSGPVEAELCTPTGAALLRHFTDSFGEMPDMAVTGVGLGMGSREFAHANCLRAMMGEAENLREACPPFFGSATSDEVLEISCSIDDMTAEDAAFAMERIMEAGALDVTVCPALMKKGRPAMNFCCLCREGRRDGVLRAVFEHTSTLGVREKRCARHIISRREETVSTKFGVIRVKVSEGMGKIRIKPEFDDIAAASRAFGVPLDTMRSAVTEALRNSGSDTVSSEAGRRP